MAKATEVFTPTDVPTVTYVERFSRNYEEDLRQAFAIPKMIVSVSGPSKSGKTVLVNKVVGGGQSHPHLRRDHSPSRRFVAKRDGLDGWSNLKDDHHGLDHRSKSVWRWERKRWHSSCCSRQA